MPDDRTGTPPTTALMMAPRVVDPVLFPTRTPPTVAPAAV
jgi:hypothetical protein